MVCIVTIYNLNFNNSMENETDIYWTNSHIRSVCTYYLELKGLYCINSKNLESYNIDKRRRRRKKNIIPIDIT